MPIGSQWARHHQVTLRVGAHHELLRANGPKPAALVKPDGSAVPFPHSKPQRVAPAGEGVLDTPRHEQVRETASMVWSIDVETLQLDRRSAWHVRCRHASNQLRVSGDPPVDLGDNANTNQPRSRRVDIRRVRAKRFGRERGGAVEVQVGRCVFGSERVPERALNEGRQRVRIRGHGVTDRQSRGHRHAVVILALKGIRCSSLVQWSRRRMRRRRGNRRADAKPDDQMGLETRCAVQVDDSNGRREDVDAKVLLEGDALIVRGEARVRVARVDIERVTLRAGAVTVSHRGGSVRLQLNDEAQRWRDKLTEVPRTRVQKLGVERGMRVSLHGVTDSHIDAELRSVGAQVVGLDDGSPDLILLEVRTSRQLTSLGSVAATLGSAAVWVIHPNGVTDVGDVEIFRAGKAAGLVASKSMSFAPGMSAERLTRARITT